MRQIPWDQASEIKGLVTELIHVVKRNRLRHGDRSRRADQGEPSHRGLTSHMQPVSVSVGTRNNGYICKLLTKIKPHE